MENEITHTDEIYIAAADYVMANAPDFSGFNPPDYIRTFKFANYHHTTLPDEIVEFQSGKFDKILIYMIQKGYLFRHSPINYELTDLAREMKRKGGYYKYWEYFNNRENAVFENLKINKRTAEASERAAIATERTVMLNLVYVAITAIIMVVTIYTCNQSKAVSGNPKSSPTPAIIPSPKSSPDTSHLKKNS